MDSEAQHPDRRTPLERAADLVDARLFDLYQRNYIFEGDDDTTFPREDMLNIARNAYLKGIADKTLAPDELAEFSAKLNALLSRGSEDTAGKAR